MKTIVIKSQITLDIDEEYDEDALLKSKRLAPEVRQLSRFS